MLRKSRKSCVADMGVKRFHFNQSEQLEIYYYVSGVEMTKEQWKKINEETIPRFISYKEWKEYVWKKYEVYTLEKLEEFYRYLNIRKCENKGIREYSKLLASNFLTFIITYCLTGIMTDIFGKSFLKETTLILGLIETGIKGFIIGIVIVFLVWFIIKIMPDYTEGIIHEQFYCDYQEIIQEMIEIKKKSLTIQE